MKILITGAAGYIGSELIGHLLSEHEIYAVDNLMYDKTSLLRYVGLKNFNFERKDNLTIIGCFIKHDAAP